MPSTDKKNNTPEALPTSSGDLLTFFDRNDIPYELYEHKPVFTVEESQALKQTIPGTDCRNLFLRDKKKQMYLVVAANETQLDLKKLESLIESKRLSFGSEERLWQYLGVRPGSVCPFSIINDRGSEVSLILDQHMMQSPLVNFHPMENHMSISLTPDDLIKFIDLCDHPYQIIDLSPAAPDNKA